MEEAMKVASEWPLLAYGAFVEVATSDGAVRGHGDPGPTPGEGWRVTHTLQGE
jgi:hypothetical protein